MLLRNPARRHGQAAPGLSRAILEGLDEILTVVRLGLSIESQHSLARANLIESINSAIRQVCRNAARRRNARTALRWTAAGMSELKTGLRRIKPCELMPILKHALVECHGQTSLDPMKAAA